MKKVLLIEDNSGVMEIISSMLNLSGRFNIEENYLIIQENECQKGLKIAEKEIPDLIISHLNMPDFSGYDMLSELRKNPKTKDIPCIMLINDDLEKDIEKAKELGITDFIAKPFNPVQLISIIKRVFNNE